MPEIAEETHGRIFIQIRDVAYKSEVQATSVAISDAAKYESLWIMLQWKSRF